MSRFLSLMLLTLSILLHAAACLVPPPLELEADAGTQPPTIRRETADPRLTGYTTWNQTGPSSKVKVEENLSVFVRDPDNPTLYSRLFVDGAYDTFVLERTHTSCADEPCGIFLTLKGPCDGMVNNLAGPHSFELYVSDAEWDDTNTKDLRLPAKGGQRDNVHWRITCEAPKPTDGGM